VQSRIALSSRVRITLPISDELQLNSLLAANHISHFDRLSFHRWYDAKSIGWP
jgi:hypothetical protein